MLNEKGFKHFPDEIDDDVIKIVREWLKQNKKEVINSSEYSYGVSMARVGFLQELLEDLDKWFLELQQKCSR